MTFRFLIPLSLAFLALAACAPADKEAAGKTADDVSALAEETAVNTTEAAACPIIDSRNWHAWVDAMPGPDSKMTLHVVGEVDMPTPGYSFEWREGIADKSATPVQRLMLTATPPDGMIAQVITTEQVNYEGPAITKMYRGILVMCGGSVLADIPDVSIAE
jgi:hypothetical protein